ncbi:transglycosylase SLT domain-containing protein [Saccharothrix sp. 6-C]|uniref:type VII secretion target n=1 Tax=Saccharothrix sp. 6-C TaxID=2781735 RepID=UPI001916DBB7|nr:type VII secretion target [Saccharothrix sp. 6-C]QQQ74514.1 transglycosylase SLT domain-containing protein [Saccharothrix sp. 6-C]
MSTLSPERIARHAHDAGFRGQDLTIAVAVALAESGGDTRAHNSTPPDDSYGLWQINMLGSMGPARRREFGLESNRELFDPAENARAANKISGDGRSWTPWSTYTNGAYKRHLDEARRGVEAMKRGGSGGGSGGGGSRGGSGGGSGGGGFSVDLGVLRDYARRTRNSADDLTALGRRHVREVREIAEDSFGRIGKQSGFADALDNFGAALRKQVKAVAHNTDALATSASRSARAYKEQEDDIAGSLGGKAGGRTGGSGGISGGGEG